MQADKTWPLKLLELTSSSSLDAEIFADRHTYRQKDRETDRYRQPEKTPTDKTSDIKLGYTRHPPGLKSLT